ncbi:MAG: sugar-binding domain-containing protein [Pseudomonadota bacterium]
MTLDRRTFLGAAGATATAAFIPATHAAPVLIEVPDQGWRLWIDRDAAYRDDRIYLPSQANLAALPVNPPTGGWDALWAAEALTVTLPTTVEEHLWGAFGERPYTGDEYRYAEDDSEPQNGAYRGVSWWYRAIDIPASAAGKHVVLHIRGARLRAEIYLNEQLVGYSIMAELPIHCDLTAAMRPGRANRLAIRITNPGGRYDWRDSTTMMWGAAKLFASHGFGGIDRGMTLSAHPKQAYIRDAWVLNTPDPREVTAHMEVVLAHPRDIDKFRGRAMPELIGAKGKITLEALHYDGSVAIFTFRVKAPDAKLWDLETPHLHQLRFRCGEDSRLVQFGFRWFAPEGIGTDALLRLNGRRIKLYSAISWGYWGYNGLWPTPELARREVTAAKALGLNCLHFHRNVGKAEVFAAQDSMGLLRVMEPGGGRHAIAKDLKPGETLSDADIFSRDFMVEKCVAMAKTFRSHPSLVQYTLQNEIGANLANPDVQAVLAAIHDADPSRAIILNDGFVQRGAAQAMYLPYSDHYYRSDVEQHGGWWVNHQGAGDQWYNKFYQSKDEYIHRQTGKPFIVEFGEMQGCAVADNHAKIVADIEAHGGKAYDLEDHRIILRETEAFLDKWGFRAAFPTAESLFLSIGRKAYDAWEQYFENIRIGDAVDMACVSGWETTAIENHSGIVDNLRHFKADPAIIRRALHPVRPCAKQHRLVYALGETAELDIYLFNDTGKGAAGQDLFLSMTGPDGCERTRASFPTPRFEPDRFAYLIEEKAPLFAFDQPGKWTVRLRHTDPAIPAFERDFWVVGPAPALPRKLRVALSGVAQSLRKQLAFDDVAFEDFRAGQRYDGIIASGLKADEIARRQIGEQTGLEAQPKQGEEPKLVLGELPADVLAAVKAGTPLLALIPEDGLADGVARQLAALGLFRYDGQVGNLRAPWMGNWNYLRAHPLFDGIPADTATSVFHQIEGQPSNGLLVDGEGVQIIAGYSRDHDRKNGAATLIAHRDAMRVVVHRLPDMVQPLQRHFLANAIRWLADPSSQGVKR